MSLLNLYLVVANTNICPTPPYSPSLSPGIFPNWRPVVGLAMKFGELGLYMGGVAVVVVTTPEVVATAIAHRVAIGVMSRTVDLLLNPLPPGSALPSPNYTPYTQPPAIIRQAPPQVQPPTLGSSSLPMASTQPYSNPDTWTINPWDSNSGSPGNGNSGSSSGSEVKPDPNTICDMGGLNC